MKPNQKPVHTEQVLIYNALKTSYALRKYALVLLMFGVLITLSSFASAALVKPDFYLPFSSNRGDYVNGLMMSNPNNGTIDGTTYVVANGSLNMTKDITLNQGGISYIFESGLMGNIRTIDTWIRSADVVDANGVFLTIHDDSSLTNGLFCYILGANGAIVCSLKVGGVQKWTFTTPDGMLTASTWTHLVLTKNESSGNWGIWVNGTFIRNGSASDDIPSVANILKLNSIYDNNTANNFNGLVDNVALLNVSLTGAQILESYNAGAGYNYSLLIEGGAESFGILVNITFPADGSGYGYTNMTNMGWNFWVNVTRNVSNSSCALNDTRWTYQSNTSTEYFFLNNTKLDDGFYSITALCNETNSLINGSFTSDFRIDTNTPTITPETTLRQNKTIVWNCTLSTHFNLSDNLEIYSINISLANGTVITLKTNYGKNNYIANISYCVGERIDNNISIKVCDAHTANFIDQINRIDYTNNGIKYVIKDNPLFFTDEYIHIYPKTYSDYGIAKTTYLGNKYNFQFTKSLATSASEVYIVESTKYIDIIKNPSYGGHLVIPSLGRNGYWVDFVNDKATKYEVNRISNTKVEVIVYGLQGNSILFNSVGELNCYSEVYKFTNINPTEQYERYTIKGHSTSINLSINRADYTPEINATLLYNSSLYNEGNESNYTVSLKYSDLGNSFSKNISFNWTLLFNGLSFLMPTHQQNVSNIGLDNCTNYTTMAINFTLRDELNDSMVRGDVSGSFNYLYGSVQNNYTLDMHSITDFRICIYPNWISLTGNYSIWYLGTDYPQRRYYDNNALYTNATNFINLYLLSSGEGIYVRFNVINSFGNPISTVNIRMQKASDLAVEERENTDDSGMATFWVNPDTDYIFTFTKSGYSSLIYNLRPTTSEIIYIQLVSTISEAPPIYSSGISYSFSPSGITLQNNTEYTFAFSLTSDTWDLESCNFYIKNNNSVTLNSTVGAFTDSTCIASLHYKTNGLQSLYSYADYGIDGQIFNASHPYSIMYTYEGEFSLKNFFDDLKNFSRAEFNDFTRMIIAFIVIFSITIFLTKQIGFVEPNVIIPMVIILVWFFSYLGWFRLDYGITIVINATVTNWLEKYFIAILVSLTGGAYLMKLITD